MLVLRLTLAIFTCLSKNAQYRRNVCAESHYVGDPRYLGGGRQWLYDAHIKPTLSTTVTVISISFRISVPNFIQIGIMMSYQFSRWRPGRNFTSAFGLGDVAGQREGQSLLENQISSGYLNPRLTYNFQFE